MNDRTHSVQEILRTAANKVAAFEDHDLAAHLDDLANDYAGPPAAPDAS